MSTQVSFDNIIGSPAKEEIFKGFQIKDTLLEYDSPLLVEAKSPDGDSWLFNWCDSVNEPSSIGRWVAFKVTTHRLESLMKGHISLRDALSLPQDKFYIFDAKTLFEPIRIKMSFPENLPKDYLPAEDISISGNLLEPDSKRTNNLVLKFHIHTDDNGEGRIPLPLLTPLQAGFQNYFIEVGNIINRTSKRGTRIKPKTAPTSRQWTAISQTATGPGSFKMQCESSGTPQEAEKLAKACELLEKVTNGTISDLNSLKQSIGNEGLISASNLAQCVVNLDVSFSMRWTSPDTPNGYFVIDKRRAQKFLELIESTDKQLARSRNVTIILNDEEAALVRKDIKGKGGHQSLLKKLQDKLKKDNTLELTPTEIERVLRYGMNYGQGGFQGRLGAVAGALKRVSSAIQTS